MNIGIAAKQSGLPAKTIRYDEEIGLVGPTRRPNGYRDYDDGDVHKLRFLRRARSLGFSVADCRQLLSLYEDRGRVSSDVKDLARTRLEQIDRKLEQLQGLRDTLDILIRSCKGDKRPECPILDDLAERA